MENNMNIFQGPKPTDGSVPGTTINPNDIADSRAMDYRRTATDRIYRYLGLHSLDEVKAKQTGYLNSEESMRIKNATEKLGGLLFNAVRRGDIPQAQNFGRAYLELNPDQEGEDHIKGVIDKFVEASGFTPSERSAVAAKSIQELQNVKRLEETRGKTNANQP